MGAVKAALRSVLACSGLPLMIVVSLARLVRAGRALRRAQVVVVMPPEAGFGHTIVGPDITRRVFTGRRCVFIAFSAYKRHNRKVASLWPDLDMVFLPVSLGINIAGCFVELGRLGWYRKRALQAVGSLARMVVGRDVPVIPQLELYERLPVPGTPEASLQTMPLNYRWPIAYATLLQDMPVPPVGLPTRWRNKVRQKLDALAPAAEGVRRQRLCGLYLRRKGSGSSDITNARRVGSRLEDYVDGIRLLNRAGYQVLLTGDVSLAPSMYREFGGMLVDAKSAGVDEHVFSLYAATEAHIFVGEAGGGLWLPGINGIPRLVLNAFPYFHGFPNSWMCYKTVRDEAGKLVHYRDLFSHHAYDYDIPGMTIHNNTSDEICAAMSSFLEDVERASSHATDAHEEFLFPEHTWIRHARAKLSPAWVRLFEAH